MARVLALHTVAEDEEDDHQIPDTRRGVVEADTLAFVAQDKSVGADQFLLQGGVVLGEVRPPKNSVKVLTNDGEWFPVRSKLLQNCIALTSAVMAGHGVHKEALPQIKVDVDCLTMDRVLQFLEALQCNEEFNFDLEYNPEMLRAAQSLGCASLEDHCKKQTGEFQHRVRAEGIRWEEVRARNESGEVLILIDGMVFDVTRWLPEHPGGNSIIPKQALNVDGTVWFEVYHASRKAFLYLEQFYIGDLDTKDLPEVPPAHGGLKAVSAAFLEQLGEFTTWRVRPKMAKTHMGQ